ncbi:Uncharacterised protein [Vibrio cholerae]|nr:Uncharacterised protein [Vibrio cholerae]
MGGNRWFLSNDDRSGFLFSEHGRHQGVQQIGGRFHPSIRF